MGREDDSDAPSLKGLDPALARIQNPDILTRVLQELEKDLEGKTEAQTRRWVLWYCDLLLELGDPKALELIDSFRSYSEDLDYQHDLDVYAQRFGKKIDFQPLIQQLRKGDVELPEGVGERRGMIYRYIRIVEEHADPDQRDEILKAFTRQNHPFHKTLDQLLLQKEYNNDWMKYPGALEQLQRLLEDRTPRDDSYKVENGELVHTYGRGSSSWKQTFPRDQKLRESVTMNNRLMSAVLLSRHAAGLPEFHPIFADEDARIQEMHQFLEQYTFRPTTRAEYSLIVWGTGLGVLYVPDLSLGEMGATEADVKKGKALFHLPQQGTPLQEKLPAAGNFFAADSDEAIRVLILQAEKDQQGILWYGAVSQFGLHVAPEAQFQNVQMIREEAEDPFSD